MQSKDKPKLREKIEITLDTCDDIESYIDENDENNTIFYQKYTTKTIKNFIYSN